MGGPDPGSRSTRKQLLVAWIMLVDSSQQNGSDKGSFMIWASVMLANEDDYQYNVPDL